MTTPRGVPLVALSGPAGTDTSSLVRRLATLLGERGVTVVTTRGHGCFLCRRFPVPPRVREEGEPGERWTRRASGPECRGSLPRRAHALLDAAELAARITTARLTARGGQAVVVTDRGPLDGLARFDPPPSSSAAAAFRRLAGRYGLTLLVETGPDPLPGGGRTSVAASTAAGWARYRAWSVRLPRLARLDGARAPSLVAAGALEQILGVVRKRAASDAEEHEAGDGSGNRSGDRSGSGSGDGSGQTREAARPHVVMSVYDSAGHLAHRDDAALAVDKVAARLAEDFRVTVVTSGRRAGTEYRDGVRYVRLPVCRAGPRAGRLVFPALLPFVARRIRHDLWLESFTPPFPAGLLPLATRAPVVGIDQGHGAEAPARRRLVPFLLVERLGLRRYRHIVATGAADGTAIRRLGPRADVRVIANGVEPRLLDESRLGRGRFILFLGRIDTWDKGLDLLLDAYDRSRPPLALLLAGSGTPAEEHRLATLVAARSRGPGPRIHWVGHADEERGRQLLRDSAFLVMPSRHEAFGLVARGHGARQARPPLRPARAALDARRRRRGGTAVRRGGLRRAEVRAGPRPGAPARPGAALRARRPALHMGRDDGPLSGPGPPAPGHVRRHAAAGEEGDVMADGPLTGFVRTVLGSGAPVLTRPGTERLTRLRHGPPQVCGQRCAVANRAPRDGAEVRDGPP
ncbi:glycosyltransferase family 4 protein [Streptomyces sp. NPDC055103]